MDDEEDIQACVKHYDQVRSFERPMKPFTVPPPHVDTRRTQFIQRLSSALGTNGFGQNQGASPSNQTYNLFIRAQLLSSAPSASEEAKNELDLLWNHPIHTERVSALKQLLLGVLRVSSIIGVYPDCGGFVRILVAWQQRA